MGELETYQLILAGFAAAVQAAQDADAKLQLDLN